MDISEKAKKIVKNPSVKKGVLETTGKLLAFSPLLFFGWEYYSSGSFITSATTCIRDFMWPIAVVAASSMNASPY